MNNTATYEILRRLQDFEEEVRAGDLLPEDLINEICNEKKLRYLTIGGHVAAAEHLEKSQSYTSYLCDGDRIVGEHVTPEDVFPCIHEWIGDNIYDVIVLDLFNEADESLLNLTRRLVNRFPAAAIFNMKHFFPGDIGFQHSKEWVPITTWAKQHNHTSMTKEFLELFEKSNRPWTIKHDERLKYYVQNGKENHVWSLFKDMPSTFNTTGEIWKNTTLRRAWMYDDFFEPSIEGHKDIARGIFHLNHYEKINTSRDDSTNPWDEGNYECDNSNMQ